MASIENRENLYGMNLPRGSFSLSGGQFAESLTPLNGKRPTDGPPMIITDTPPGVFGSEWVKTFGASRDAYLTIVNGKFLQNSMDEMTINGVYKDGSVNADNDNLWKPAEIPEGSVQQVQYIVSKETIDEASSATDSFGEIVEARGIGLRIPTIAGGYGRTIDGLPTDPQPTDDLTKRKNDEAHKVARETWKYGPIEYRWDYRRGVWSAYNELIVDHEGQGLGTWVFSTNPDEEKGFPFLRGRLEDVWWVRQPHDLDGTDGTQEGVKTGEIMTHLEHRWYDDNEKAAAKLSSIFIIPHEESAHEEGEDGGCHFKSTDIQELGEESTASADRIDIRSTVHFFKEKGVDGPIKMDKKISELEDKVCCQNPDSKYFFGEMVFLDEPIPVCSEGGNYVSISDGDSGETCKWVPAIQIDECELMGGHMVKLVTNDMNLGSRISEVCNEFADYTTRLAGVVDGNIAKLADAIDCLNDALQTFAAANNVAHAVTLDVAMSYADRVFEEIEAEMGRLVNQINQALQLCGCEGGIVAPHISFGPHGERPGQVAIPDGCNVGSITRTPELDCDVCYGTRLHGPCTTQEEFVAGRACGPFNPPVIDTEHGKCETHSDI